MKVQAKSILIILKFLLNIFIDMDDIYKNIEQYSLNKKRKVLIVFDEMIADMLSSNKLNSIVYLNYLTEVES